MIQIIVRPFFQTSGFGCTVLSDFGNLYLCFWLKIFKCNAYASQLKIDKSCRVLGEK